MFLENIQTIMGITKKELDFRINKEIGDVLNVIDETNMDVKEVIKRINDIDKKIKLLAQATGFQFETQDKIVLKENLSPMVKSFFSDPNIFSKVAVEHKELVKEIIIKKINKK